MWIWVVFIGFMLASWLVSRELKAKVREYSQIPTSNGASGKEVAEKMLHNSDIYDVKVVCVNGELSDHYNPVEKTVNLSKDVYAGRSVAAAAIAAHECGHAVQHATAYSWLRLRSMLVPPVQFASKYVPWILLLGIIMMESFPQLLLVGIILFATTTLFSIVTLPVEIDASRRALAWIDEHNITSPQTHGKAQKALRLAAYTYVIAALSSLATLLYYVMIYLRGRD